jgi:4-carboxymuconolactone decarboxylase
MSSKHPESSTTGGADTIAGRRAAGSAVRRAVLGEEYVDRASADATAFAAPFQDFITRYAWGEVWTRDGLDRRTRSAITLAMLASLQHHGEFSAHVSAALRNGMTVGEIREVLLQVAIYAGVPAANRAFALANDVLAAEDVTA